MFLVRRIEEEEEGEKEEEREEQKGMFLNWKHVYFLFLV